MDAESYRELKVLEELSANSSITQRHLALKLEVALGLANLMMHRLVKKGYIKVVNIQSNRIKYLLTPHGLSEKTRLTYEYLEYSLHLYRSVRRVLKEALEPVAETGRKAIVLLGVGEIAEIIFLTLKELNMDLVAVADDRLKGGSFLGVPVLGLEEIASCTFDFAIVSVLRNDSEDYSQRLKVLGVEEEKIMRIEQQGPVIRAVLPAFHG